MADDICVITLSCLAVQASQGITTSPPVARRVVEEAIGELRGEPLDDPNAGKNPAAVALGKLAGAKGGAARAVALSPRKRKTIARKAAEARWKRRRP